jgi:hypothetical protein
VGGNAKDREHEIYWWRGLDGARILMKWNSLLFNNQPMGEYAEARDPFKIVDFVDSHPAFVPRYPYPVIGAFGKGWDDAKTLADEFIKAAQVKTTSQRRVLASNEQDFFEDLEANYGANLPTTAASFGKEWEALAALVSLENPGFMTGREADRDQAWVTPRKQNRAAENSLFYGASSTNLMTTVWLALWMADCLMVALLIPGNMIPLRMAVWSEAS